MQNYGQQMRVNAGPSVLDIGVSRVLQGSKSGWDAGASIHALFMKESDNWHSDTTSMHLMDYRSDMRQVLQIVLWRLWCERSCAK